MLMEYNKSPFHSSACGIANKPQPESGKLSGVIHKQYSVCPVCFVTSSHDLQYSAAPSLNIKSLPQL